MLPTPPGPGQALEELTPLPRWLLGGPALRQCQEGEATHETDTKRSGGDKLCPQPEPLRGHQDHRDQPCSRMGATRCYYTRCVNTRHAHGRSHT